MSGCFIYSGLDLKKPGSVSYERSLRFPENCPNDETKKELWREFQTTKNKGANSPEFQYFKAYAKSKGYAVRTYSLDKKNRIADIILIPCKKSPLSKKTIELKASIERTPNYGPLAEKKASVEEAEVEMAMNIDYFCSHRYYEITNPEIKSPIECRQKINYSVVKRALAIYFPKISSLK